ncbi:uncharacterized protein LOC141714046 [Apium graveolens]|uniref:uncharacterized protein LOC141714046 n=1 Tax=Apium graveolens TaxID=4045 RepID=UPI003D7A2407
MEPPKCIRDIQKLTGQLAALRRFISRSDEKALSIFAVLKGSKAFEWGPDCQKAFEQVPKCREVRIWVGRGHPKIATLLPRENSANSDQSATQKILTRAEASGRVVAWSIELGEYNLEYIPRTSIKAQALANFMVECTFYEKKGPHARRAIDSATGKMKTFVDGSVAGSKCGAGFILSSPEGSEICQAIRFTFLLTNNEAEYQALLAGLSLAKNLEVKHLRVFSDSILVVKHFSGEYNKGSRKLEPIPPK